MKTYLIEINKDEKDMIKSVLTEWIEMTKDSIRENEREKNAEAIKELKQEMKIMRQALKATRSAKEFLR